MKAAGDVYSHARRHDTSYPRSPLCGSTLPLSLSLQHPNDMCNGLVILHPTRLNGKPSDTLVIAVTFTTSLPNEIMFFYLFIYFNYFRWLLVVLFIVYFFFFFFSGNSFMFLQKKIKRKNFVVELPYHIRVQVKWSEWMNEWINNNEKWLNWKLNFSFPVYKTASDKLSTKSSVSHLPSTNAQTDSGIEGIVEGDADGDDGELLDWNNLSTECLIPLFSSLLCFASPLN